MQTTINTLTTRTQILEEQINLGKERLQEFKDNLLSILEFIRKQQKQIQEKEQVLLGEEDELASSE
jgi:hypothetical protein